MLNTSTNNDYSGMSKLERCALVERIFIEHPRLTKLLGQIRHCQEYSRIAAEPECMFIGGYAGTGKTTLQEYYASRYPRTLDEEGSSIIPVLCGRVPEKASNKTLVTELLHKLGDPVAEKGSAYNQTTRFRHLMKECRTELTFLDEFQHFVDKDSQKVLKNLSDWLKNLIDETNRPIIMCGMPYADIILDAPGNEQLQRRFSVRASLDPFGWQTKAEKDEFQAFLQSVDRRLPFHSPRSFRLAEKTVAFRFYCATNGRVGKVMKVIRRAAELVINNQMEGLGLEVLAEAYDERLRHDQPDRGNPFCSDLNDLKIIPFKEYLPNINFNGRGSSPGAEDKKANEVLRK
jgi:hypothetical protein